MKLIKGLSERVLLKRIARCLRLTGLGERALGFFLLDLHRRGLYRRFGFAGTIQFALIRFQIPPKKTRELLRVARALEELPRIDRAFAAGRLTWSAVREMTRVAVAETEAEWLDLAEKSTLRQIERVVSRTAHGDRPVLDPAGLPRARVRLVVELDMADLAIWQTAFDRLAGIAGSELDASTAVVRLAQSFLEQPLAREEQRARKAFQVVYHRCSECDRAWVETDEGPAGVPTERVTERETAAEVIRLDEPEERDVQPDVPQGTPPISTPVTPQVPRSERDKPHTPQLREQVLSRDSRRCAVPGCGRRNDLQAHHVVWRSHGGRSEIGGEVAVCRACHGLIHEGLLKVTGTAPHGLVWLGPEGEPLTGMWTPRHTG